jgi:ubiquitin-conjugating enzyme E2 G1
MLNLLNNKKIDKFNLYKNIFIIMALKRLQMELTEHYRDPNYYYSIEPDYNNFLKWNILLLGPTDTIFEGGIFKCELVFSKEYPNKPPAFKFITNIPHPNIYPDGKICISILHQGIDQYGYEDISERWSPSQSVNSIILSVLSLLSSPNFESPANVDASRMWQDNFNLYKKEIYKIVSQSI